MSIREVILALLFAVVSSVIINSPAEAQQALRRGHGASDWHGPQQPNMPTTQDQAQATVNSYIQNQTLDLSNLLGLTQSYRQGEVIDSVTIYTTPTQYSYGSQMLLIANGMVVAADNSGSSAVTMYPSQMVQLNGYYGQVTLQVQGTVYISQIVMRMHRVNNPYPPAPPPMPPPQPGPIPAPPGQGQIVLSANLTNVGSNARVELVSILNLNAYQGYRLQSLIITGRSAVANQAGIATLTINNVQAGQASFDHISQAQSIPLRGAWIAGVNALQMSLDLRGVQAMQVQLVLSR
jgi:hypothetical protein